MRSFMTIAMNGEVESGPSDGGYLADGHTLTAEERAFLQSNLPPGKNIALDEDILWVHLTNTTNRTRSTAKYGLHVTLSQKNHCRQLSLSHEKSYRISCHAHLPSTDFDHYSILLQYK